MIYAFFQPLQIILKSDQKQAEMKLLWALLLVAGSVRGSSTDDDKKESVGTVVGIDLGTTYSW